MTEQIVITVCAALSFALIIAGRVGLGAFFGLIYGILTAYVAYQHELWGVQAVAVVSCILFAVSMVYHSWRTLRIRRLHREARQATKRTIQQVK